MAIKAYWRLNGNSNDASGNGYDGTDTSISYVNNSYAVFNGSTSKIVCSTSILGAVTTGTVSVNLFSKENGKHHSTAVEAWAWTTFLSKNGTYMALLQLDTNKIRVYYYNQAGSYIYYDSNVAITLNKWQHIMITWDANGSNLYINGALDISDAKTYALMHTDGLTTPFTIGYQSYVKPQYFNGNIDDLKVDLAMLPNATVKNEYSRIKGFF